VLGTVLVLKLVLVLELVLVLGVAVGPAVGRMREMSRAVGAWRCPIQRRGVFASCCCVDFCWCLG
jgi:hypothetical protein